MGFCKKSFFSTVALAGFLSLLFSVEIVDLEVEAPSSRADIEISEQVRAQFDPEFLRAKKSKKQKRRLKRLESLSLVMANGDSVIGYDPLLPGSIIDVATLPAGKLSLRANFTTRKGVRAKSVRFSTKSTLRKKVKTRGRVVKELRRGARAIEGSWSPLPGIHRVSAKPYQKKNFKGKSGRAKNLTITVIDSSDPDQQNDLSPIPTPAPPQNWCTAGEDKVLGRDETSVRLTAECMEPGVSNIVWRQLTGPTTAILSNSGALDPVVSGLQTGVYIFELTVNHDNGVTIDTAQIGISENRQNYDFSVDSIGPLHVVQGSPLFLNIEIDHISGSRDYIYLGTEGLPAHADIWASWNEHCCVGEGGEVRGYSPASMMLRISTGSSTPAGMYPITFRFLSGGVIREHVRTVIVDPFPAALPRQVVVNNPPIPELASWERNMTQFGAQHCSAEGLDLWEGNVWYYDGMRVYYQMADYTGNAFWKNTCVPIVKNLYRQWVLDNNGQIQGWRVFPHGLQQDYVRNGDEASRNTVALMAENSAWTFRGGDVDAAVSRETAYLLHAYMSYEELGYGRHPYYERALEFALGHLDQIAVSRTYDIIKPFMIGLTFEALIRNYEKTGDPRIPIAVKRAADFLWEESGTWNAPSGAFLYINRYVPGDGPPEPAADLNLLVAPAYAWLYNLTGDPHYQRVADQIFAGGVPTDLDGDGFFEDGACLACNGKQFSQNYRWSFDFIKWRSDLP